ncbi:unnamed protein product [Brassica oleracea var. botrytis]|uniref:Peptidase C1A papain C-terminal domain-containing protein n=1 Tax=Brassica oleracea TaxID=3712 RepID=A0A3P6GIM7_BRAOL|nr:unnamed protein product [Brassica oleracea]
MLNALRNTNLTLVIFICSILIASRLCTGDSFVYDPSKTLRERFKKWLQTHSILYGGKQEWMLRFGIYQSNLQLIDYINSLHLPFKLTDNRFADMTNAEFKAHFLGLNTSSLMLDRDQRPVCNALGNVPASVDWRKEGAVTPIRNQGKCGGCWAFTAVAAIEGINKIKTGNLVSLSEQQLIDCDVGAFNKGCSGGLMTTAYEYLIANGGLVTEADYPYTAIQGTCDQVKSQNKVVTIQGYTKVEQNEASLQAATAQQPVSVGIDAGGFIFQLYSSGVFTGFCGNHLNHGVTVVGYGEEDGQKYWIVKNSWGTGWGEQGYVRMERGYSEETGKCGIAMLASYPTK